MISKLCIGCVKFGKNYGILNFRKKKVQKKEIFKILNTAKKFKINSLDTASDYGVSEKLLGEITKKEKLKFNIITKLPNKKVSDISLQDWYEKSINSSLKKLKLRKMYGILIHDVKQLSNKSGERLYESLTRSKKNGEIKKIGLSIYDFKNLDDILKKYPVDIIQVPINVIDRRLIKSGWLKKLKRRGIEIHARSIFLKGLLLLNENSRPKYFNLWKKNFNFLDNWIKDNKISRLEMCINFIKSIKEIDKIVVGISNRNQLYEIVKIFKKNRNCLFPKLSVNDRKLTNPALWKV